MSDFQPGLEGVIAFETEIAEPDKEGSALRYRGVDIEELVGRYPFEKVWGLLVDQSFEPGMPHAERIELQDPSGSVMADLQAGLATLGPKWGLKQLVDIEPEQARDDLARLSAAALSIVAQGARGDGTTVPEDEVERGENAAAQFLIRWRGEADPKHVKAVDTYWVSAAEHGMNASTFTARVAASTGADCAAAMSSAVGALSGPLHGGAPTRVLRMLDEVEKSGDAIAYVRDLLDRGERIMGFGHRVYRAEDPRARVLRRTARELGSSRVEVAEKLEEAALAALREKSPDRVLETNVEFWAAVVLEIAEIPPDMYPAMFGCARVAGWSAHIVEQRRTGRLIRPSARYVGAPAHSLAEA
jgi:citrate synthase